MSLFSTAKSHLYLIVPVLALAACQAAPEAAPIPELVESPTPEIDSTVLTARQEDLDFLVANLKSVHPNPLFSIAESDFDAAVANLEDKLSDLTDIQMVAELSTVVALLKDGHTFLYPLQDATGFQLYPIQLYAFEEGIFVVDALPPHESLIGARLVSIGEMPVEEAQDLLAPTISRDNASTVKLILPVRLVMPEMLLALGIIQDVAAPDFVFESALGEILQPDLTPISYADYRAWVVPDRPDLAVYSSSFDEISFLTGLPQAPEPLYLSNKDDETFWVSHLEDQYTLYVQYNFVIGTTPSGERLSQFVNHLDILIQENDIQKFVLDVRHNPGGNNSTYAPLLNFLSSNESINQPGKLFVLVGRNTFSAAANFVTEIEQRTDAIFVGEPTGGSPNLYGDARPITLPNSGIRVNISTRYWEISSPDDDRLALEPQFPIGLSAADYFAAQDPLLEFIFNYPE